MEKGLSIWALRGPDGADVVEAVVRFDLKVMEKMPPESVEPYIEQQIRDHVVIIKDLIQTTGK
jgi:hypothetical protein